MTAQAAISSATKPYDAIVLGAGLGGLCMAIQLRQRGNDNFIVLEKGADVGGTWRDNSYPGCACDVQSHMYSFSFEGKADWTKRYAPWHEIRDYILKTTDKYGIRPFCRFNQEVTSAHFDEKTGLWDVGTTTGEHYVCRHFIIASGPLHVPQIPDIKGLDTFKGKVFHSARWDHEYDLKGKNVVSIGSGGSAIQYCPEIAPDVNQLYVFQRTPAWVIPRDERKYSSLTKEVFKRFPLLRKAYRARLYWTNESRVWPLFNPSLARGLQKLAEASIRFQVKDSALAKKLTPEYTLGCKRILISNKWYPMFNRKNVELVTEGIQEVREHSVITKDGKERPADCIILGTGFIVDPRIYMSNFPVTGLGGRDLREDWKDHSEAYFGASVSGYPNLWQLVGPNAGLGHNSIIFMIEAQVDYILRCMEDMSARGAIAMDVRPEVQREFNQNLQKAFDNTVWTTGGCASWYQQADGQNFALWPKSTWRFWLETRQAKSSDYRYDYAGAEVAANSAANA